MTHDSAAAEAHPVARMLNPRSVAIIGMSGKPGSSGRNLLAHLEANDYGGEIHLVGRAGGTIDGRAVLTKIGQLPEGVELALIAVPAPAVAETVAACAERKVHTGIIYASGFAELGEEGRAQQAEITRIARASGMRLAGPNCIGYNNYVDGLRTVFLAGGSRLTRLPEGSTGALAVLAQSGGMMGLIASGLAIRKVPVSYSISTGNEASLTLADYLDFLADDPATGGIAMYIEDIRDPQAFLKAVRKCRARGKTIVLTHAGRSERGQRAAASHTGALAADYGVMKSLVTRAGAGVVESIEELLDVAEILTRAAALPRGGIGVATTSGAFCALALDTLAPLGVDVPDLTPVTVTKLTERLPSYMAPANPLDIGTLPAVDPDLYHDAVRALLDDERIGSVLLGIAHATPEKNERMLRQVIRAAADSHKPVLIGLFGDVAPVDDGARALAAANGITISNSPERLMRAMASVMNYVSSTEAADRVADAGSLHEEPSFGRDVRVEWRGKEAMARLGLPVPQGGLARSVDEAVELAAKVGYPVVAKLQSADLLHKTEAGGVVLGISDEQALRAAYADLTERVGSRVNGRVDGVLIEEMAAKGLELMVGAKRHPAWGPVVVVGLGGVLVEALGDVRLLPPDLATADIIAELRRLRSAKLLDGFRGAPASDLNAVAEVVSLVGRLMSRRPDIEELDINPLLARPDGVLALDVLMTFSGQETDRQEAVR